MLIRFVILATTLAFQPPAAPRPLKPVSAVLNQPGSLWQDPHGRYTLSLPAGWGATGTGDDPIFRNGSSWAQARLVHADSASDAVDLVAAQFRTQFGAFDTINRGNTTIAGRAAHGLNVDATSGGQRVSVLVTAQPDGKHQFFVLISETPVAQAPHLNTTIMVLAGSVHFLAE